MVGGRRRLPVAAGTRRRRPVEAVDRVEQLALRSCSIGVQRRFDRVAAWEGRDRAYELTRHVEHGLAACGRRFEKLTEQIRVLERAFG